jgi:uncharacterized Zn finger protein (UPF0148 family)
MTDESKDGKVVLCPICEHTEPMPEVVYRSSIGGVQVPTPDSLQALANAEVAMHEHVSGHSTLEVMEAFAKADAYIEQLEADVERLTKDYQMVTLPRAAGATQAHFQQPTGDPNQGRQRQEIEAHDADQTLIPVVPQSARAEGQVGRKF